MDQWQEEWAGRIHIETILNSLKRKMKHKFNYQEHDKQDLPKFSRNILQGERTLGHSQFSVYSCCVTGWQMQCPAARIVCRSHEETRRELANNSLSGACILKKREVNSCIRYFLYSLLDPFSILFRPSNLGQYRCKLFTIWLWTVRVSTKRSGDRGSEPGLLIPLRPPSEPTSLCFLLCCSTEVGCSIQIVFLGPGRRSFPLLFRLGGIDSSLLLPILGILHPFTSISPKLCV